MAGRVMSGRFKFKQAIEVTETASKRLKELMSQRKEPSIGIRLGLKKRGCNGLSYTLDYATEKKKFDEEIETNGIKVFIEPQALVSVVGTKMDFIEDRLKSEFVFINPNAKSECPCGQSFNVD